MSRKNKNTAPPESLKKDNMSSENAKDKYGAGYFIRIAGVLTLICSVVALMLSAVNLITFDRISENTEAEKRKAVAEIFTDMSDAVLYNENSDDGIYLVMKDGMLYGYCAPVISQGYGGPIEMMVGVDTEGAVKGVKIVSMSETAGLGSKTRNDSFLSQFSSSSSPYTVGGNIDAVAGATISSKAVTAGVNSAFELNINLKEAAAEKGLEIWPGNDDPETEETSAESEETETSLSIPHITLEDNGKSETNIPPDALGNGAHNPGNTSKESSYTGTMEQGYYIEKETTDTEETSAESIPE